MREVMCSPSVDRSRAKDSSRDASGRPRRMFSSIVRFSSPASWNTVAIWSRSDLARSTTPLVAGTCGNKARTPRCLRNSRSGEKQFVSSGMDILSMLIANMP